MTCAQVAVVRVSNDVEKGSRVVISSTCTDHALLQPGVKSASLWKKMVLGFLSKYPLKERLAGTHDPLTPDLGPVFVQRPGEKID